MTASGFDGSIKIDTQIDKAGFNAGVTSLAASAKVAAGGISANFNATWAAMSLDQKTQAIQIATNRIGQSWHTITDVQKLGVLQGVISEMGVVAPTMNNTAAAVAGVTGEVTRARPPLTRLGSLFRTFGSLLNRLGLPQIGRMFQTMGTGMRTAGLGMKVFASNTDEATVSVGIFETVATAGLAGVAIAVAGLALSLLGIIGIVLASGVSFLKLQGNAQGLKDSFGDLKNAFAIAFAPLIQAVIPYIQAAISWLIRLFNTVAMITGALLGQKEVWQAVEGGTAQAAKDAKDLADNTGKAKKEAQGALAAFDQLNVLQKPTEESPIKASLDDINALDTAAFKLVPVTADVNNKVNAIRQTVGKLWEDLKKGDWKQFFSDLWTDIGKVASFAWKDIQKAFSPIGNWFNEHVIKPVGDFFSNLWSNVSSWAVKAWDDIVSWWSNLPQWFKDNVIDPVSNFFSSTGETISQWFSKAIDNVKGLWGTVVEWFKQTVTDPIQGAFKTATEWIQSKWRAVFTDIKSFVKGIINDIISFMNTMLSNAANGINGFINTANSLGSVIPGWQNISPISAPQIPFLAAGAVIPPNAQFAAILGDQKSGTNIETPENLLRQIIGEELAKGGQELTINFAGSIAQFIRLMKPYIDKENVRVGSSLIKRTGQVQIS